MIFRQFLHTAPIGASYLFGCGGQGQCIVVDPVEDIGPYQQASRETGMRIMHVIDTHVHADHRSGGRSLADAVGASYLVHESIDPPDGSRLAHDQELSVGNVTLRVLHTPGHTPEHISLLVADRTRGPEPWFVLTGHTLMVGDMGRTELATSAESGALALFESAARLRTLSDHGEVWPRAFATEDRDAFVQLMIAEIPARPENADQIRATNLNAIRCATVVRR